MVNPFPAAEAAYDRLKAHYARKYDDLCNARPGWTEVSFTKLHNNCIMDSNYVALHVFHWLEERVGPMMSNNRNGKEAWADDWAYTMAEDHRHVFLFRNSHDAVVFKLTWA